MDAVDDPRDERFQRPLARREVIAGIGLASMGVELAAARGDGPGPPGEAVQAPTDGRRMVADAPYRRSAPGAVPRSIVARLDDLPLTPEEFGATGNGEADDSTAFVFAIREAVRRRNATITLTGGKSYRITTTLNIPQGVAIVGPGSQGTTSGYGCSIRHAADGDLFIWDGSGAAFAGTGGGLRNLLIVKAPGFGGGSAITLVARDATHRPGEMLFENIVVYGESGQGMPGFWNHGVVIDGRLVDIEGTRGVRSTRWIACRFAGARAPGQTIVLRQATHVYFLGCAVDQGGSAIAGVTLEGRNDNVNFVAIGLGGDLLIAGGQDDALRNFNFSGKIGGRLVNDDPHATGAVVASFDPAGGYVLVNKAAGLRMLTNIDPNFRVVSSQDVTLKLGADPVIIGWDRRIHDRGNNVKAPTDQYICANAGMHHFSTNMTLITEPDLPMSLAFVHGRANGDRDLVSIPFRADRERGLTNAALSASFDLGFGDSVAVALHVQNANVAAPVRLLGWDRRAGTGCWFEGNLQD